MKNKFLLAFTIVAVVPLAIIILLAITKVKTEKIDTNEAESYIAALKDADVAEIEEVIRNQHTIAIETTSEDIPKETTEAPTETPTEPPTEPPTEAPTEPVVVNPAPGTSNEGFVYSSLGSYNPYAMDQAIADATADKLATGELSYDVVFAKTAFVGDSVMDGFNVYMHFPITYTEVGASLANHLPTVVDNVIARYPSCVVVRYGINEMDTTELAAINFAENFRVYMSKMKASLPNTKLIVAGITPVGPAAIAKSARFGNVPMYNAKIKAMCMELGIGYYENASIFINNTHLYSKDGIHLQPEMYRIWLRDMVKEMGIY